MHFLMTLRSTVTSRVSPDVEEYPLLSLLVQSLATSPIEKANLFNEFFYSVFNTTSVSLSSLSLSHLTFPDSSLCSITICEEDVYSVFTSLDSSKAVGGDNIPPLILEHCAGALSKPLHHLFSLCLSLFYLPMASPS